ncbi:RHS repeat-associated core domain-containing protein [Clostridium sp. Marseille-P2415]|uniref:RHS repeat-associated core domain-containing protein n=1 Tax=Clostridium sp. Marseille-P2415 TaxID=1805471 RepID=UPI000988789E|nr:RHS repeat-associated core domain-containing protein [Clostridium sp. Marseille-P2415]
MILAYKELEIELALEGVIQVETFRLTQALNSHGFLSMKLLTDGEKAEEFVNMASVLPVIIRETECTGGQVIFQGKIENVYLKVEKGLPFLYLEAYSYTKDWERTEKSRSFLDGAMTYMDVARKILADYDRFDVKDEITKDARIPEMLLQYEESDWVFLRRLASHFGTYLLVDASEDRGKVYFGIPDICFGTELHKEDYILEKDLAHYAKVLEPLGILSQEASQWKIHTRRYLHMGEGISFHKVSAVVTGMEISTRKGELVYRYELSRKEGLRREKEKNPRIYGMSIPATVKERSGNRIRVQFDIDPVYEPAAGLKYFTYAIESSSFYCMPEEGSRVHIYFPEHDEQSAVAVHAIGSGSGGGESRNPDNKSFSDPSGSAMDMTADALSYAPDSSGSILLKLNKGGYLSLTGMDINIKTQKGMMAGGEVPVRNLMISGENKVVLQIGDGGDDMVTLEERTDIKSDLVSHKADSCLEAVPSAGDIKAELTKDDASARDSQNSELTSALVARKQQSKQKFFNGVVSIATVVGLTALTVCTGGASAPLLVAAGVKATFAVADMAEGLDGYSKVNALDASRPANFLRDTVFMGNENVYNIASMVTDVVFDVVSGKALKNLASAGKLSKLMCPKSQVVNFVTQTGGSVIFGAINEYETTGTINITNMAVNAGLGMFKGSAGTAFIGKAQGLVKSDSRLVNKLVGTVAGTAFGTVVDVASDALLPDRKVDVWQSLQNNFITSGLGQLIAEPVDVASGAFLISATDFVLPDIRESIRITRKYHSTRKQEGIMGTGWSFPYEGKLYQDGSRRHVTLDTGYYLIFEWDGEKAHNETYGCGWFELLKDHEEWLIKDRKEHRTYRYSSHGLLLSIMDRNEQTIRFTYHGENLEGITTALGYHLNVTIRAGHLVQLTDNMGRTMQYRYEGGLLTDVIHMDQGITHYEYDEKGYLTRAVDQAKVTYLENRYDNRGRMVLQTLASGDTYEAEYLDGEGQVRVHSSVGDKTVVYGIGKKMEIVSILYEDGTGTFYDYNENGYRIREKDRLGHIKERTYDETGRVREEHRNGWLTTSYFYNESDDLVEETDNAGRKFCYEYDKNHNLIEKKEKAQDGEKWFRHSYIYDRKGRLLEETNAAGNTTVYHYEENSGMPSVITYPDGEEARFEYDTMGRMMAEEDDCGRTEYGYNAKNYRTLVRDGEGNESRFLYDGMGRLLAMYPPKAWKEQKGEYTYRYDFLDRLIDTVYPDEGHERQMRDGEGNVLKKVHPNAYDRAADNGEGIVYDYDGDGNQIRIHYPDGGCERIFYDANGNRIKHVLPEFYDARTDDGEGWLYTYDDAGHLETVTGPDGGIQAGYTYDISGNPTRKTDAMGRTTWYTYNWRNQLCETLRPAKEKGEEVFYQKITYSYDANGNKVEEQRHGGYWNLDGQLREEDGPALCLKFFYDKRDRLIRVEDGLGAVIRFRYDIRGKRIYEEKGISEGIKQIIHYGYDRAGRLIETKEELDSGLVPVQGESKFAVTRYSYDENGNRTQIRTPEGYEILREYDSCDRLITERTIDKQNGINRTVSVSYDKAGNITRIARQGKGGEVWELEYDYDLKDRIIHVSDCLGPVFRYEYDRNDRLEREILPQTEENANKCYSFTYSYDHYGNVLSRTDGIGTVLEENQYLPNGNLSFKRTADGNELTYTYGINDLEAEIHTTRSRKQEKAAQAFTYDANGRIIGIVDGNQNQTGIDTDIWGRIQRVHNADGGKEKYTYDNMGNVTSTTDANGGVITYRYNSRGKVCEIIDPDGNSETFHYDREGRSVLHIDRDGNQIRTTYNVDGNPVLETGCDAEGKNPVTRSWEYDTSGMRKKAVAGGFCYTYEYRPDGKLKKKSSSGRTLISCTYHPDGSLKTLTDVTGKTIHYGYDWRGNLSSIREEAGNEIVRYGHRADGKLEAITHQNGVKTVYEYDTDGNISRLATFLADDKPLFDFRYEYDLNGNRMAKAGVRTLSEETGTRETVIGYRYDKMNRLTEEMYDGEAIQYIYDLCGNRMEKNSVAGKETYCYNRRNQLIERKMSGESYAYRYDKQGNIMEEAGNGEEWRYHYNPFGQQTAVEGNGFKLENFYDGEQLRAGKSVNGKVSRFIFYNGELQAETGEAGNVGNRYILGYGIAASEVAESNGYHAYHLDEKNNTAYITGNQRKVENFYEYDAFGVIRSQSEEVRNRTLYTGQQYDQETGQYYLRARFYNPVVGRFLQEDVYRGDGLNLYAYCANNPVVYYDPSGYNALTDCEGKDGGTPAKEGTTPSGKVSQESNSTKGSGYKVLGGRFADVDATRGADEVGHHVAQNRYNQDIGISRADGPALLMSKEDHALTRTFRGRGKAAMINDAGLTARQRMVLDIVDIRKNFGTKYNKGMLDMISYAKTLPQYSK